MLHTHHHRDQCWGTPRLARARRRVAVPEYERHLFEQAELFWQTRRTFDNYNDRNTFFTVARGHPRRCRARGLRDLHAGAATSSSSCRPRATRSARAARSPTSTAELVAFTGDLLAAGGKLYQLHAMEYTYGSMEGVLFTLQSLQALRKQQVRSVPARRTASRSPTWPATSTGCSAGSWTASTGPRHARRRPRQLRRDDLPARAALHPAVAAPALGRRLDLLQLLRRPQRHRQGAVRRLRPRLLAAHAHRPRPRRPGVDALRRAPPRRAARRLRRDRTSTSSCRRTSTTTTPAASPTCSGTTAPNAGRSTEVGQVLADPAAWASTPCTFPQADPHRPLAQRRRALPLGGVRVRDPLRPGPDGVPLGLRRPDRRPQGRVHRATTSS